MAILGNIFLSLATLIYLILLSTVFGKEPPRSGDAAVGYPLGVLLFHLLLFVFLVVAAIAISSKQGFDWISPDKTNRNLIIAAGLLLMVGTSGLTALFKYESGPVLGLLRFLSGFAPALFPFILIV